MALSNQQKQLARQRQYIGNVGAASRYINAPAAVVTGVIPLTSIKTSSASVLLPNQASVIAVAKRAAELEKFKVDFKAVADRVIPLATAAGLNVETAKAARDELADWSKKYNDFFK